MLHFYSSVRELTVSKLDQSSKQPMANPSKMPNLHAVVQGVIEK